MLPSCTAPTINCIRLVTAPPCVRLSGGERERGLVHGELERRRVILAVVRICCHGGVEHQDIPDRAVGGTSKRLAEVETSEAEEEAEVDVDVGAHLLYSKL